MADTQVMFTTLLALLRDFLRPRHDLILENLALRQQILVLQRTNPKPPFRDRDRAFWVVLCQLVGRMAPTAAPGQARDGDRLAPQDVADVVAVEEQAAADRDGRAFPWEVIELIRRISRENPTWGAPRIHGELLMLGLRPERGHRRPLHDQAARAADAELEDVPDEPPRTRRRPSIS